MEDGEGITPSSGETGITDAEPTVDKPWFAEYADSLCSYYMSIGVPYDTYWDGDFTELRYYREAEEYRQERDNYAAWLQGIYVYEAVGCLAPILHAFAKRGTKPGKYPEKPYSVTERQRKAEEEAEKAKKQAEVQNQAFSWLSAMRQKFSGKENKNNG